MTLQARESSIESSIGWALTHLEWRRLVTHVWERLLSPGARARAVAGVGGPDGGMTGDRGGAPDPDALLPRSADPQVNRRRLRTLDALELVLDGGLAQTEPVSSEPFSLAAELRTVEDVSEVLQRAGRGTTLDLFELCAVKDLTTAAQRIAERLEQVQAHMRATGSQQQQQQGCLYELVAELVTELGGLAPPAELTRALERSLECGPEPALSDEASPALGGLRRKVHETRRSLISSAERLLRRPTWSRALADQYWTEREGRVVLPVRSDGFSRAGSEGTVGGIIHAASGSGQTLFVEPHALVDDNNALREAVTAVRSEERRILARLSSWVGECREQLQASLGAIVQLDHLQARLSLCKRLGAHAPTLSVPRPADEDQGLVLPAARHPLLMLRDVEVVPSDLSIGLGSGLVISGPNAGGKTVALKTIGLCVLMASAGLRLPTGPGAHVPLFEALVTDVGDDQSISADLSTFSAHVRHVMDALDASHEHGTATLVLLDEVAVGTDPDQGSALAEAILVELLERGATLVVTTHYERLKLLAATDRRFVNAAVGFDLQALRPTFELRVGAPGSSSALAVARRLGMPESVLQRAESAMATSRVRLDALLQEVEAQRTALTRERESLQRDREVLQGERAALELREQRAEQSAARRRAQAHQAATSALRGLEDDIKRRRKSMKKAAVSADETGVTDPHERAFARQARTQLQSHRSVRAEPQRAMPQRVELGSRVHVAGLDAEGEVVEVKGDRVTVQLGAVRTTVDLQDVRMPSGSEASKKSKSRRKSTPSKAPPVFTFDSDAAEHFGADAKPVDPSFDDVLDLRGARAEDALSMLEVFLDRAIAQDREVVVLRHGHGSGALRKAVREHLPRLGHVHKQRAGLPPEGGDAVTVVWIRP